MENVVNHLTPVHKKKRAKAKVVKRSVVPVLGVAHPPIPQGWEEVEAEPTGPNCEQASTPPIKQTESKALHCDPLLVRLALSAQCVSKVSR